MHNSKGKLTTHLQELEADRKNSEADFDLTIGLTLFLSVCSASTGFGILIPTLFHMSNTNILADILLQATVLFIFVGSITNFEIALAVTQNRYKLKGMKSKLILCTSVLITGLFMPIISIIITPIIVIYGTVSLFKTLFGWIKS